MTDDSIVVTWQPRGRAKRRVRFEPREADTGFLRVEEVHDYAGEWRGVGSDVVDSVTVETPDN